MRGSLLFVFASCNPSTGGDAPTPPGPSPVDVLADAFGGRTALEGLTGFTYVATGTRYILGQGPTPARTALPVTNFDLEVSDDRGTNSLRYSWDRTLGGASIAIYDET